MITIEQIKNQVESVINLVKDIKNIEDCRNLRHYGCNEDEIFIELENGDYLDLKDAMTEYPDWLNTTVVTVTILDFENLGDISYHLKNNTVSFDVYDKEYDPEYPMIEDATLKTLEEQYQEAIQLLEQEK